MRHYKLPNLKGKRKIEIDLPSNRQTTTAIKGRKSRRKKHFEDTQLVKKPRQFYVRVSDEQKELYKEYITARNKLKSIYYRQKKRGFKFDYEYPLRKLSPRKVTPEDVEQINKITKADILSHAWKIVNGKKMSYEEYNHYVRSEAAKKSWETRRNNGNEDDFASQILEEVIRIIRDNFHKPNASRLFSLLTAFISEVGQKEVARRLYHNSDSINIVEIIVYGSNQDQVFREYSPEFISILSGGMVSSEESEELAEQIQEDEMGVIYDEYYSSNYQEIQELFDS